mgnify:CR=1 FL=1
MATAKSRSKTMHVCSECGGESPKWQGQCPQCQAWNTLVESVSEPATGRHRFAGLAVPAALQKLADVNTRELERISTGVGEFDRVLGGGWIARTEPALAEAA